MIGVVRTFALALFCLCLAGCSYTSYARSSQQILGTSIKASGVINAANPQTSLAILDEFYDYLQNSLGLNLDQNAASSVVMKIAQTNFEPLYYDQLGFARSFKATVVLEFNVMLKDASKHRFYTKGHYTFNTNAISTLSDDEKSAAVLQASKNAMADFASKLGALNEQNKH